MGNGDTASAVQLVVGISTAILGVSHIVQPRLWREYFAWLHGLGLPGVALNGQFTIIPAVVIVALHSVWQGPEVVVTAYGWLLLAKSMMIFFVPPLGLRSLEMAKGRPTFVAAGLMLLAISGFSAIALLDG